MAQITKRCGCIINTANTHPTTQPCSSLATLIENRRQCRAKLAELRRDPESSRTVIRRTQSEVSRLDGVIRSHNDHP